MLITINRVIMELFFTLKLSTVHITQIGSTENLKNLQKQKFTENTNDNIREKPNFNATNAI